LFRLVIADDEHRVCQLIQNIIPWNDYQVQVSGTAYNGIDALRLIQEVQPDIVITDIRMPGYDGITLIGKSKALYPDISFIIVSGYRDFEYAQSALKFGADDYLLKPISGEEIKRIIMKVLAKKMEQEEKYQHENRLQSELLKSRETLRKQFAKDLIDRECRVDKDALSDIQDRYLIRFQSPYFQVLIVRLDNLEPLQDYEPDRVIDTIREKVEITASACLEGLVHDVFCTFTSFSIVYILNTKEKNGLSYRDEEELFEAASQKLTEYGKWKVSICIGRPVHAFERLSDSYSDALLALRQRIFHVGRKIYHWNYVSDLEKELLKFDLSGFEKRITTILGNEDISQIKNDLKEFFSSTPIFHRIFNPDTLQYLCTYVTDSVIKKLQAMGSDEEPVLSVRKKAGFILDVSCSIELLFTRLIHLYVQVLEDTLTSKRIQAYKPIRIAIEYIEKHHAESIDLNLVAKEAGFNPIYFSSLFKKETGINFKDYIQQKRIETAKELLLSSNQTILAISEKVGYKDVRYFSKIFTKIVGIKPHMYRKIYG